MLGQRIKEACKLSGMKLKQACDRSGISYGTLYNQIKNEREIPFSSISKLAATLGLPLSFFEESRPIAQEIQPGADRWQIAEHVNVDRAACSRAGFSVTTDHVLDWYQKEGAQLKNWEWLGDQIDLYKPLEATDSIMHPLQIGKRSTTAERLMLGGNRDFYHVVGSFDKRVIDRAMQSHKALQDVPYIVTDEELDVTVKGQKVLGGYRKVSMRLTDPDRGPVTAIFSKLTWLHAT
ncbi:helix-turn-helix domain-containing protein [Phaeobacter sp. C3_T13_0]|uniref:helix-turn-helix domain-containing protein n=1 Tax=Phaeobacter cretensis TaxID=3342641 RepID=UPI0039BC7EAB